MTTTPNDEEREVPTDEQLQYARWRYDQARELGLSLVEAQVFRDTNIPVAELRKRVSQGVPPKWLAEIVL